MPAPQTKQELQSFLGAVQLPADIRATPESSYRTAQSPAEKGEHIHMGPKCEQQLPENQRFVGKYIIKAVEVL